MTDISVLRDPPAIAIRTHWRNKDKCKAISGARWNPTMKAWLYPATPSAAREVYIGLGDLAESARRTAAFNLLLEKATKAPDPDRDIDALPDPPSRTKPWAHQKRAFYFARELDAAYLAMEMGTGKSKVTVDLLTARGAKSVLISAPLSVVNVWQREFSRHAAVPWLVHAAGEGATKKRAQQAALFLDSARTMRKPAAIVVNHDSLWRGEFGEFALATDWDAIVIDESHRAKAWDGRLSSFLGVRNAAQGRPYALRDKSKFRLMLSGTPLPHSPLDVFAQYRFLDPGIFGEFYHPFRRRYAVMGGFNQKEIVGYQNTDDLNERMYRIMFRVLKADALDLPPELEDTRPVLIPTAAKELYQKLDQEFYAGVADGSVTVTNALTKLLRLQQITSGFVKADDDSMKQVHEGKIEALQDLLEDVRPPVVVFARFLHDLDAVHAVGRLLGWETGEISGRRKDLTPDATMPEHIQLMAVQIHAGGVGIDLTRASTGIYYSAGFSLEDYEQSRARLHRPGQTRAVTFYHLTVPGTVDEKVYTALRARKNVVEWILTEREKQNDAP